MKHPRMAATLLASAAIMGLEPLAQADTSHQEHNVVVPKHDGTTYTSGQRTAVTDASADLRSQSLGGDREVEVCVSHLTGWVDIRATGTWRAN